jgi:hypothetical protein
VEVVSLGFQAAGFLPIHNGQDLHVRIRYAPT